MRCHDRSRLCRGRPSDRLVPVGDLCTAAPQAMIGLHGKKPRRDLGVAGASLVLRWPALALGERMTSAKFVSLAKVGRSVQTAWNMRDVAATKRGQRLKYFHEFHVWFRHQLSGGPEPVLDFDQIST